MPRKVHTKQKDIRCLTCCSLKWLCKALEFAPTSEEESESSLLATYIKHGICRLIFCQYLILILRVKCCLCVFGHARLFLRQTSLCFTIQYSHTHSSQVFTRVKTIPAPSAHRQCCCCYLTGASHLLFLV